MKKLVPILVCFVTIVSLPRFSFTQIIWSKIIGGNVEDSGMSVQQTADGGYITVGNTNANGAGESDIWLIKTDAFGSIQWNKKFGDDKKNYIFEIQQTTDGGFMPSESDHSK